ncbi:MAG: Phosphoribosylaminoimidazole-succinocarboxamide synthase [Planctomycetota bacterium]
MVSQSTSPPPARVSTPVFRTELPLPGRREGKVRDVYRSSADPAAPLLIVATDRLSAFDVVMPTPVAGKGCLLTTMSLGWFAFLRSRGIVGDHVLGTDLSAVAGLTDADRRTLAGRSMLCRAARVVPIECVARGYLAGSGWNEYREHGTVCGIPLPKGLVQCSRLPQPIFTPATKAEQGHDENISFERACELVGAPLMTRLRDLTLAIYSAAAEYALERGVILADTKFEFGFALGADGKPTDELILVDEVLTPDSSRYWPANDYAPGRDQQSYDKQFVRNYLLKLVAEKQWNKEPPGPPLPADIVEATVRRYEEALAKLALPPFGAARGGTR